MEPYRVGKFSPQNLHIEVPASKSVLARALVLASLNEVPILIRCGTLCGDSLVLVECLKELGSRVEFTENGLLVCGGFRREASVNVGKAGTAARFLPALVAFRKGICDFSADEQMMRRPMDFLRELEAHGVVFDFKGEPYHFPFRMDGTNFHGDVFRVDTAESTQYASALMLAACASTRKTRIELSGPRVRGSYLLMTRSVLEAFGAKVEDGSAIEITPPAVFPKEYVVEPDLSSACYFYALSLLFGIRVTVKGVRRSSLQGDVKFLDLLKEKGVRIIETEEDVCADGSNVPVYNGIDVDLTDFSDQALTVAALALFASSPSILRGLSHTKKQESDRVRSILENVNMLGARAFEVDGDVFLEPAPLRGGTVKTFGDHRVAMAFALVGLKTGTISLDNATCCEKTFPDFFRILEQYIK